MVFYAAKSIGYKKEIKSDNFNEILNEFQRVNSVLNSDYKLSVPEAKILKEDIINNPNQYEVFDENHVKVLNENNPILTLDAKTLKNQLLKE